MQEELDIKRQGAIPGKEQELRLLLPHTRDFCIKKELFHFIYV